MQALPPSAWPYFPLLPRSNPQSSLWKQDGDFSLLCPYRDFPKLGVPPVRSICIRRRTVVLLGHMKQVARTSAATPHSKLPLPTAATAKTILFFCFPHLKKGLQPNCRPWPCFIFPTCILLTPFSYGTYGACHQMRRRHILQFWWKEQQWALRDTMNNFCSKYISCVDLSCIWVMTQLRSTQEMCLLQKNAFELCKSLNWKTNTNKPTLRPYIQTLLRRERSPFWLEYNWRKLKEYTLLWWWNFHSSTWRFTMAELGRRWSTV